MTAIDELRSATRALHDRLEEYPYAAQVLDGTVPLGNYAQFLAALAVVHGAVEELAGQCSDRRVQRLSAGRASAMGSLGRDLAHLASLGHGPVAAPAAAWALAAEIRRLASEDAATLAGVLYVLEGSKMGGLVQSAALSTLPELRDSGRAYLSAEGSRSRAAFRRFVIELDDSLAGDTAGAIRGAVATFEGFAGILGALGEPSAG